MPAGCWIITLALKLYLICPICPNYNCVSFFDGNCISVSSFSIFIMKKGCQKCFYHNFCWWNEDQHYAGVCTLYGNTCTPFLQWNHLTLNHIHTIATPLLFELGTGHWHRALPSESTPRIKKKSSPISGLQLGVWVCTLKVTWVRNVLSRDGGRVTGGHVQRRLGD